MLVNVIVNSRQCGKIDIVLLTYMKNIFPFNIPMCYPGHKKFLSKTVLAILLADDEVLCTSAGVC